VLLGRFSVADGGMGVGETAFGLGGDPPPVDPSAVGLIRMGPPIHAPQRGLQRAALAQVEPAGSEQSTGGFNPRAPGRTKRSVCWNDLQVMVSNYFSQCSSYQLWFLSSCVQSVAESLDSRYVSRLVRLVSVTRT
jgi:hypothetical protein